METKTNALIQKPAYNSPELFFLELYAENIMAVTSGSTEWYDQGGQGNFSYTVEEDSSWK